MTHVQVNNTWLGGISDNHSIFRDFKMFKNKFLKSLKRAKLYPNLEDTHLNAVIVTVNLMSIMGEVPQAFIIHRENPRHPRSTKTSLPSPFS